MPPQLPRTVQGVVGQDSGAGSAEVNLDSVVVWSGDRQEGVAVPANALPAHWPKPGAAWRWLGQDDAVLLLERLSSIDMDGSEATHVKAAADLVGHAVKTYTAVAVAEVAALNPESE